jgi:hypothetical protein
MAARKEENCGKSKENNTLVITGQNEGPRRNVENLKRTTH